MDFEGFNIKRAALAAVVGVAALILMIMVTGRMVHLKTAGSGKDSGAVSEETVQAGQDTGKKDDKEAARPSVARDSAGSPEPEKKKDGTSDNKENKDKSNPSGPGTAGTDTANGTGNQDPNSPAGRTGNNSGQGTGTRTQGDASNTVPDRTQGNTPDNDSTGTADRSAGTDSQRQSMGMEIPKTMAGLTRTGTVGLLNGRIHRRRRTAGIPETP